MKISKLSDLVQKPPNAFRCLAPLKRLMNHFKGILVQKQGNNLASYFEQEFNNYLLKVHEFTIETLIGDEIVIDEDTKAFAAGYAKEYERAEAERKRTRKNNFKLISKYVQSHEYSEGTSYECYLGKLYKACYDNAFKKYIKEKILGETIDKNRKDSLFLHITSLAGISHFLQKASSIKLGLDVKSIIFIEELGETGGLGNCVYFSNKEDLSAMSIYRLNCHSNSSFLFDNELGEELLTEFVKTYPNLQDHDGSSGYFDGFEDQVKLHYNQTLPINEISYSIKPVVFINFDDENSKITNNNILNGTEQSYILDVIRGTMEIEKGMYNREVIPKITIIHFKRGDQDLILIKKQDRDSNRSVNIIYELLPGESCIGKICVTNNELFDRTMKLDLGKQHNFLIMESNKLFKQVRPKRPRQPQKSPA